MLDVICNTSPLQYLHQMELLHLLPALFEAVQVPSAVAAELAEGKRRGVDLPELAGLPWVAVRSVRDIVSKRHPIEAQTPEIVIPAKAGIQAGWSGETPL